MKIWRKWRKAAQAGMRPHLEDLSSIGYLFYQPKVPPEIRWCLTLSLFSKRQVPAAVAGSWTHCLCNAEAEGKGRVGYTPQNCQLPPQLLYQIHWSKASFCREQSGSVLGTLGWLSLLRRGCNERGWGMNTRFPPWAVPSPTEIPMFHGVLYLPARAGP